MAPAHRSLLLLVVVVVVSAAHAAVVVAGADEASSFPDISTTTDPRGAALQAFQYVKKEGESLSLEMDKALAAPKEPDNLPCLQSTALDLKSYVKQVATAEPEKDFNGARDVFDKMLHYPSGFFACKDVQEPVIQKLGPYEVRLQATSDLFNKASTASPPPA